MAFTVISKSVNRVDTYLSGPTNITLLDLASTILLYFPFTLSEHKL
jgi:hypothetical protein